MKKAQSNRTPAVLINQRRALYETLIKLNSVKKMERFFDDLCTPSELQAMSDRWEVAKLISRGTPYRTIQIKTGVSTATITRVARCVLFGSRGYSQVLETSTKGKQT